MVVKPIKTGVVKNADLSLSDFLDKYLDSVSERSVFAITSKVVAICEKRIVPVANTPKKKLIKREADLYTEEVFSYGSIFTVTNNTFIRSAGIDESNGNGNYVLWPIDPQASANNIRSYLKQRFKLKSVGVIITDSSSTPLRRGTSGIYLAHSGFAALKDYRGSKDLFGRTYEMSRSNVASGLAAAAVVAMGEGTETTPICIIEDVPFVQFQDRDPNRAEIMDLNISIDQDIFAPFLTSVDWKKGKRS